MTFNDGARIVIAGVSVSLLIYALGWVKARLELRKRELDEYWRRM